MIRAGIAHRHRTRHDAFLAQGQWDAPALLEKTALSLLSGMKPKAGEVVHLILDDTRIAKHARKMDCVSKIWEHKRQKFVRGHRVLTCAVAFRGVVLPWRIDLWKPKGHAGNRYRKLTDRAARMIRDFAAPRAQGPRALRRLRSSIRPLWPAQSPQACARVRNKTAGRY